MTDVNDRRNADPITTEVVRNHLVSIAEEMKETLVRTAHHTMIYETQDFGISVYDRRADLVADAPGLAMFLGANDYSIKKGIEYVGEENLYDGDIVFMNYPYWSSRHPNDGCLFSPVYYDGDVVNYVIVRAHLMDVGAKDPAYLLDSTDVHQEGILLPGTKIHERGEPNEEILELFRFNSRMPETVLGDINAEIAAIRTGQSRLVELYERHGTETVERCIEEIIDHGERKSRQRVEDLPDGTWSAEEHIDTDGVNDDLVTLHVEVTVDGPSITVDFSGSDDQTDGPVNVPIGMTEGISKLCLKRLTTPETPSNEGHYRPLDVVAPEGSVFNATYPAPTFTIFGAVHGVNAILKALARGMPDVVPASSGGDLGSVIFYGRDPESGQLIADGPTPGVGWGASDDHDGENAIRHPSETTTQNVPVEVLETNLPVRFERVALRRDSGGPGRYRGGLGVRRDVTFERDFNFVSMISKTRTDGWGIDGGEAGAHNAFVIDIDAESIAERDDLELQYDNDHLYDDEEKTYTGIMRGRLAAGERISIRTGGGGGFGDPFDRPPETVREDVADGYVSREHAEEAYGVAITPDGEIDRERTRALRE